ncbi:hypothetical protein F2Q69_00030728, partial [Brassica cretica]
FKAKICLVTSFREQSYIEILPHNKNPLREAWLSFWSEVHYNSLYSSGVEKATKGYVPMKYRHYTRKMKKNCILRNHFEVKICLVTSFREQSYIEILPHNKNPLREAWLSFWSEVHYNSLYSSGVPYSSRCSHKTTQEEALALLGLDSY